MLSWVDRVSRKAVTRFGDHRLVDVQVTGNILDFVSVTDFIKRSPNIMYYTVVIFFSIMLKSDFCSQIA